MVSNLTLFHFSVNMTKLQNIQRTLEAQLARDVNLKESAQRAFVAYVKSVFLMKDKEVFDVSKLDTDAFARYLFHPDFFFHSKIQGLKSLRRKFMLFSFQVFRLSCAAEN